MRIFFSQRCESFCESSFWRVRFMFGIAKNLSLHVYRGEAVPAVPNLSDLKRQHFLYRSLGEGDGVPVGSGRLSGLNLKAGEGIAEEGRTTVPDGEPHYEPPSPDAPMAMRTCGTLLCVPNDFVAICVRLRSYPLREILPGSRVGIHAREQRSLSSPALSAPRCAQPCP